MNIIWSEKINLIQILLGLKNHPNTNTNIIRFEKITRIRIRILFGLKKSPEYEYEYYSVWKYRPNTNIIRLEKIPRIRIQILVFGLKYSNNIWIPNYSLTSDATQNPTMPHTTPPSHTDPHKAISLLPKCTSLRPRPQLYKDSISQK